VNPRLVAALVLSCLLLAGALFALGREVSADGEAAEETTPFATGPGSPFEGALMPPGVRAPDFELRDERGRPVSMRDLRGEVVIVTFLYASCDETCPTQAQQVRGALDQLGHDVPALAVSVDPSSDTPAKARSFNAEQRVVGRLRWVLGSREELRRVWRGFAIQPQAARVEHQARVVIVDRRGFQRIGFPVNQLTPDRLAHDVALLERERR
jgi:protein SCO1